MTVYMYKRLYKYNFLKNPPYMSMNRLLIYEVDVEVAG